MLILAHLGSTPSLSVAELRAVLPGVQMRDHGPQWVVFEAAELPRIDLFGGTIRFVDLGDGLPVSKPALTSRIAQIVADAATTGRVEFGCTVVAGELNLGKIGMLVKGLLQAQGVKSRFTASKRGILATGLVRSRAIVEVVLAATDAGFLVGRTVAVQDPKAYVFRDTVKPARNLRRGMLPPKLAQILLNLASPSDPAQVVLDPFCGTGTVLLEGMVQGRPMLGSDIDPVAVHEAQTNLAWFSKILQRELPEEMVRVADARDLPRTEGLGGIATEGTLGELMEARPNAVQVHETHRVLASIYQPFFHRAALLLPSGGAIAMTLPAYRGPAGHVLFPTEQFRDLLPPTLIFDPLLPDDVARGFLPRLTPRGGIIVDRPDQFVGREVIRLRKR